METEHALHVAALTVAVVSCGWWCVYTVWYVWSKCFMGGYSSKRVFTRFNEQQRKAYGDYARYVLAFVIAGQECTYEGALRGYIQWWDTTERRWRYHSPDGVVMEWREALEAWTKVR